MIELPFSVELQLAGSQRLQFDVDDLCFGVAEHFFDPFLATDTAVLHAAIGNAEVMRPDRVDPDVP